jgi:Fe-S-cluster-containing dehydrogenase component
VVRISRRTAIKSALFGGVVAAGATVAAGAEEHVEAPPDARGLLYDATLCIGCKACVTACKEANGMPAETGPQGLWDRPDDLSAKTRNIIKLYRVGETTSFVKRQCMHCVDPACVGACMMGALKKREYGIVSWDGTRCVGCRYCQIACPYNVPKFEWETAGFYNPRIVKCELCRHRLADGREPACTEVCPRHAVIYGTREELLKEAHKRIAANPKLYQPKVYGEHDGGGTQVLYLSHVDFDKLGLPTLPDESSAETTRNVQSSIYKHFVAPVALYGVLATVISRNQRQASEEQERP